MLSYPSAMDLSTSTLRDVGRVLRGYRRMIGSRWRKLSPGRQALLVLAHLRCRDTYTRLTAGIGVGSRRCPSTSPRPSTCSPRQLPLATAVQTTVRRAYMILDGTLLSTDRVGMARKADRPYYSGKHQPRGLNVQVLGDPAGRLIWASPALLGSAHDLTASGRHGLVHDLTGYQIQVGQPRRPRRPRHHPRPTPWPAPARRTDRRHAKESLESGGRRGFDSRAPVSQGSYGDRRWRRSRRSIDLRPCRRW